MDSPSMLQADFRTLKDADSEVKILKSSYRVKSGNRPGGARGDRNNPGGKYDGTFIGDYEFVEGHGDLDECNGRFTITPEFPKGTYAYFLTEDWPVIPRLFRGTPHQSFAKGRAGRSRFWTKRTRTKFRRRIFCAGSSGSLTYRSAKKTNNKQAAIVRTVYA